MAVYLMSVYLGSTPVQPTPVYHVARPIKSFLLTQNYRKLFMAGQEIRRCSPPDIVLVLDMILVLRLAWSR